jgi:hypothetical protein
MTTILPSPAFLETLPTLRYRHPEGATPYGESWATRVPLTTLTAVALVRHLTRDIAHLETVLDGARQRSAAGRRLVLARVELARLLQLSAGLADEALTHVIRELNR